MGQQWRGMRREDRSRVESRLPLSVVRPHRILLYSHDTYGLGHFRRNSAIAHEIRRQNSEVRIVMLTGSRLAGSWHLPAGVELVRMPSVVKVGSNDYRPVGSRSMSELRAERVQIIASTLLRLQPDIFLVDHSPLGMKGELTPALALARVESPRTRVVLGLRDILDDPATVRRTWTAEGVYPALTALYDQVLVYGCRELFDVTELYAFEPSVRRNTVFTGYVAKPPGLEVMHEDPIGWAHGGRPAVRRVLVMGGGGGDAAELFHDFLKASPMISRAGRTEALLVTGPLMPDPARHRIESAATRLTGVRVVPSSTSMLRLIAAADVVVSMGGYNSVVEAVSARRPLVVWPRTAPRREQLIRARLLKRLGLARLVMPGPDAAHELGIAIVDALEAPAPRPETWRRLDLGGGERVARLLLEAGRVAVSSIR